MSINRTGKRLPILIRSQFESRANSLYTTHVINVHHVKWLIISNDEGNVLHYGFESLDHNIFLFYLSLYYYNPRHRRVSLCEFFFFFFVTWFFCSSNFCVYVHDFYCRMIATIITTLLLLTPDYQALFH